MLAARALDSLVRTRYGDSLVIVEWHPYSDDSLNINPDDSLRVARYQHNPGQPSLVLDGYIEVAIPAEPGLYFSAFDDAIQNVKSDASYFMLDARGEADSATGRVVITLAADSIAPGTSPTLYCIVAEDSLTDALGAAYFRVPTQLVPDRNGLPVSLARGDTLVDTLEFSTAGRRLDMLGAAVFVEDANGTADHRVLQSATIKRFTLMEEK
jgi:hypothetical protein